MTDARAGVGVAELERLVQERTAQLLSANEALARLADIVESTDVAIVSVSLNGSILTWNRGAEQLYGYSESEMAGRPAEGLIAPDRAHEYREVIALIGHGERLPRFRTPCVRKDGSLIDVSITPAPIYNRARAIVGASLIARDISDVTRAEEEIKALNRQLQGKIAELETVNAELEAFSYSVSHDLRAPVRHVVGFAALLESEAGAGLPAAARRHLTRISDAASRMGRLIDDLLAFSRMSRVALRTSSVDLGALVRDVQQELEAQQGERRVEWRIGELPVVDADPSLLRQVLVNLMANALKYTRPRDVARITIDQTPAPPAAGEVVVFVRDNGVGFDMEYVNKLFGVFQRLHGSDEFEGTGIGLANVRRIVHRHGGRTWAEGEAGRGATFYFSLPRKGGEAA